MLNKIKKYIISNWFYIIFCFLFLGLMILDLKEKLDEYGINSCKYYIYLSIFALLLLFVINLITKKVRHKEIKEHRLFALLALILGVFYLFLSPLFTGSDEHNHYYRIYEISEGKMISEIHNNNEKNIIGSKMPSSLYLTFSDGQKEYVNRNKTIKYYDEKKMAKQKLNKDNKEYYGGVYVKEYNNTALYSPLQYLPEVIGFSIGKLFNLGPFYIGYLGRIFNLIAFICICTYFLKLLPKFKKSALVILLSPTVLYSATTLTADGFTIALVFAFISLIMYNIKKRKILQNKEKILYFILSILISSCKIVYLPIILLLFLLPNECFKSKRNKLIFIFGCLISASLIGLLWIKITGRYFEVYYVHTELQKQNIIKNPIWYLIVIFRTYMMNFSHLLFNIFGGNDLYHAQLNVYTFIPIMYILLFFKVYISENKEENSKKSNTLKKLLVIFVILAVIVLISTAIYIQCTANSIRINNPTIGGLQGRYFLPLVIVFLLYDGSKLINIKTKKNDFFIIKSILIINWFIMLQMFVQFII